MLNIRKAKFLMFINEKHIKIMKSCTGDEQRLSQKSLLHPMVVYSDLHIHNPYHLLEKTVRMKIKLIVKY